MEYIKTLIDQSKEKIESFEAKLYYKDCKSLEEFMNEMGIAKSNLQSDNKYTQFYYMGSNYHDVLRKVRDEYIPTLSFEEETTNVRVTPYLYNVITHIQIQHSGLRSPHTLAVFIKINSIYNGYVGRKDINIAQVMRPSEFNGDMQVRYLHPKFEVLYHLEQMWQPECSDPEKELELLKESLKEWSEMKGSKDLFNFSKDIKNFIGGGLTEVTNSTLSKEEVKAMLPVHLGICSYDPKITTCIGYESMIDNIMMIFKQYNPSIRKYRSINPFDTRMTKVIFELNGVQMLRMWLNGDHQLVPLMPDNSVHILVDMTMALYEYIDIGMAEQASQGILRFKLKQFAKMVDKMLKMKKDKLYIDVNNAHFIGYYNPLMKYITQSRLHKRAEINHKRALRKEEEEKENEENE
jgi:hypothetical protein